MKFVVGYDTTPAAQAALELARIHAKACQATIHLAACLPSESNRDHKTMTTIQRDLDRAREMLTAEMISCQTHLLTENQSTGENIVELARRIEAHEIYIGVRRRSKVSKFVFGSNAQFIILEAHCPVVTVK